MLDAPDFQSGDEIVVRLGGDTNGAVTGARFGASKMPPR